jgi:hypothetical protein
MKTGFDMVDFVYNQLTGITLTGAVHKSTRPAGSLKEDIVVGAIAMAGNDQIQTGEVNVNIYVPNITVESDTVQDSSQPNIKRFKVLTTTVVGILKEIYLSGGNIAVTAPGILYKDQGSDSFYTNIRVRINFFNQ